MALGIQDTDELDEAPLFGSFSSCSPRYKKSHGLFLEARDGRLSNDSGASDHSESCGSGSGSASAGETDKSRTLSLSSTEASGPAAGVPCNTGNVWPDSSQEVEESSPQLQRRRRLLHRELKSLPRFSICLDDSKLGSGLLTPDHIRELSPVEEGERGVPEGAREEGVRAEGPPSCAGGARPRLTQSGSSQLSPGLKHRPSRTSVSKSSSISGGLSLVIPLEEGCRSAQSPGGGSSTASSRDTSPCRELSPTISSLKPPIILRRAPRGFGFTLRAIRVYLGDSDFYTVHHLVMAVDDASPALEAGLRPGDLITHINGEPVQGLFHTQVYFLLIASISIIIGLAFHSN